MRLELNLQPLTRHDQPLVFGWDSETGELWGRDAERVKHFVRLASASDYVSRMPGDGGEDAYGLLTNLPKFCDLLKSSHVLPPEIFDVFSTPESSEQNIIDIN